MNLSGAIDRLDDWINPIVIKELRQAVKSRVVSSVLLLFVGIQLSIVAMFLAFRPIDMSDDLDGSIGQQLFLVLQAILLGTCMVLIPAYAAIRLSSERSDTNVDLLFISTLRPTSIIVGKFFSALVLAMLVFSCCAPFMTFTYLLRGIDIPTILFLLGLDLLAIVLSTQFGLFLASIPVSRGFKIFLAIGAFLLLCYAFSGLVYVSSNVLQIGLSRMEEREFWLVMGSLTLAALLTTGLLFCWSVALISPPSSNRALMGRLFLVVMWFILGAVCLGLTAFTTSMGGNHAPLILWMVGSVFLFCIQFVISINERDSWGSRVARTIPRWTILRPFAFLFYSGAAGGVLLSVIGVSLTLLIGWGWREYFSGFHLAKESDEVRRVLIAAGLYTFCYGMSAVLLRAYLFPNKIRSVYNWVLSFLLTGLGCSLPWIVAYIIHADHSGRLNGLPWWILTNPFWAVYEITESHSLWWGEFSVVCFLFLGIWSLSIIALSVPWVTRQIARFYPPAPQRKSKKNEAAEPSKEILSNPQTVISH